MSNARDATELVAQYEMIVSWSEPDHAYVVEVPELAGCMADGPTRAAAIAAAEIVIREWIETARELGRPIPLPRQRVVR